MKNIKRNPDVVWREEEDARDEVIAAMQRGEDASSEGTVLLVVSGMMHQLNILGGEVWMLIDGARGEDDIVRELHKVFDVDEGVLREDVRAFLDDLSFRGWISHEE